MATKTKSHYREVRLPDNRNAGTYKNPMSRTYQYEYALYSVVSGLFSSVHCRSMCIDRLKLYFAELKHGDGSDPETETEGSAEKAPKGKTRAGMLEEMTVLVNRDVAGKVRFPSMHECRVESCALPDRKGAHTFVFTDGVYGFSLKLDFAGKGSPAKILVTDLFPGREAV